MKLVDTKIATAALLMGISSLVWSCRPSSNTNVTPYGPDSISGYLVCEYLTSDSTFWMPGVAVEQAHAYFKQSPTDTTTILVDSVLVNNRILEVDGDSIGYFATDSTLYLGSNANWVVGGNSYIPSFSYGHTVPFPTVFGTLPDTFKMSTGVTFSLSFQDADSVIISLPDSTGSYISKTFLGTSTSQSFTSNEIAALKSHSLYDVTAMISTTVTFSGKKFLFTKVRRKRHWGWIQ